MRHAPNVKLERLRFSGPPGTNCGAFVWTPLRIIVSDGMGWDHVSVSLATRCPTWEEMAAVKELVFRDDEVVMQLHPAKKDHVNYHPFCLHLWRPQTTDEMAEIAREWIMSGEPCEQPAVAPGPIPLPDPIMVAPLQHQVDSAPTAGPSSRR